MFRWIGASLLALMSVFAHADDTRGVALALDEAQALALERQPLLDAQRQAIQAQRESAVAAAQLPDPTLSGGITDLTLTGGDRFTLRRESDTQLMVGIRQSFPGGDKRALRGARGTAEADRLFAELAEQTRMVRRETGLMWLEVWKAQRAQSQVRESINQAKLQVEAVRIAFTASRATQAEVLAAQVSLELLNDQLANLEQMEWHARNQLRRWIGAEAERLLCPDLPTWPAPDAVRLTQGLEHHPHIAAQSQAVTVAAAELKLAHADYRPDWSVQLGYGHRPEFPDYAALTFEVGLPLFTANRQDRGVEAGRAGVERAEQLKQDALRQHRAEIALNVEDWTRLQQRLARYDGDILPRAQQRLASAQAAYGAGAGTLAMALEARRSLLDIELQKLDLEFDAAKHQVTLEYFAHPETLP